MSKQYTERICYRNGIVKPENKVLELKAFCDCDKCKIRRKSINHGLRNILTVKVEKIERLNEAKQFILDKGTNIKFGARPLRRSIKRYIEDEISEKILRSEIMDGQTIKVDFKNEKLIFEVK